MIFNNAIVPALNRPIIKQYEMLFNSKAIKILITPYPGCYKNCCHENVIQLVREYGGKVVKGYYIVCEEDFSKSVAIYHSVWKYDDRLIDPTPFNEGIEYHTFIPTNNYFNEFLCIEG
jgi:hypothetical protein